MQRFARPFLFLFFLSITISCKKSKDQPAPAAPSVVHGKVYGKDFVMASGRANTDVSNGIERVIVNLSANASFNCASAERMTYSVYFRVPKKVGIYTAASNDIWLGFDDTTSENSVGFVGADSIVEIISVSNGRVNGKISFSDQRSDSSVAGTFDVAFCQ